MTSIPSHFATKFSHAFRWNSAGSIFYETLKIFHQFLLFKNLDLVSYGKLGSIFSIVYLIIHLFSFEAESSLSPFASIFTKNRKSFVYLFLPYIFFQIPLLILGGAAYFLFFSSTLFLSNLDFIDLLLPFFLIFFEGIRMLLRATLHLFFINKSTILVESILMIFYLSMVWTAYLFFGIPLTLKSIILPYLATSLIAISFFCFLLIKYYLTLPKEEKLQKPKLLKRIIKTRIFNYLTHLSGHLFSGNFLIPFFAFKFGFAPAGIFKFASYLATAIKGIIHVTIGFSGNALLASLKNASMQLKHAAFYTLSHKLNSILYFSIIFLMLNYKGLFHHSYPTSIVTTSALSAFFIFFSFSEYLLVVYEQFYIIEELASRLFIFKTLEILIFFLAMNFGSKFSPIIILLNLTIVRLLTFSILATNAYATWKIKPYFKTNLKFLAMAFFLSFGFYLISDLLKNFFNFL